ncbi:hypothetical protein BsWGS_05977 [Bradybaena similaris]
MPPNGTSTQATNEMVNGMCSPPSDSSQDSQETFLSPGKKSPRELSKLDKAREQTEQLQDRQVQLLRGKTKWKERKKLLEDILDKMKHSKDCLEQTCSHITETNDLSADLDNDILSAPPSTHSSDQTVKQVCQATRISCVDNNHVQGKVQDSFLPEQILPKQIMCPFENDSVDTTYGNPICFNDSPVYVTSPEGRSDHDISDCSDDSGKSTVSDNSKHSPNGFFFSTQQEHHYEQSLTAEHHLVQHHENSPISENHIRNNKEENNYMWLAELDIPPLHGNETIENFVKFLQGKSEEDKCQPPCVAETPKNSNTKPSLPNSYTKPSLPNSTKPSLPNSNTKHSLKRQSCSWDERGPARRPRHMIAQEACLIRHKSADNTDVKASVLVAGAESTNKSESSTEVSPVSKKLHVPELDKGGSLADNETNENTFTKEDKEKGESGKKLDSTPEKPQTEAGRSSKECQSNINVVETDVLVKTKDVATISDPAKADRSHKMEHTETYKQQVGGHNIDAALNTVAVSTVLEEETPVFDCKVKVDSVMNKKCQVITDNRKEQLTTIENNDTDAVLQTVECPKETPKAFGSDVSGPSRINDGIKETDVLAVQITYTVEFIDAKSHIKVLQVNENGVADLPTEDTATVPTETDNAYGQDETGVCNLKEHDLKPNTIQTRESSNTTGSATKALSKAVMDTKGERALVDTNNEKDCISIMENTTMNSSESQNRRMIGLNTTGCEEKGIAIIETLNVEKNVATGNAVLDHPNKLRDSKDKEKRAEVVQCDDHKSDCNKRKRLSKTVNNVEAHLNTSDNVTTKETYCKISNCVGGASKIVSIYIKKASIDAGNSASQQNKVTGGHDCTRFHRTIYSSEWRERLFCFYISLAMSLFLGLLAIIIIHECVTY